MKAALWVIALLALGVSSAEAHASDGRVLFVAGEAHVERAAKVTPLAKDLEITAGDLLVTSATGRVQLLMQDGDRIALRPNTRFRVEEFRTADSLKSPGTGRSFYNLLKGGLQTLTRSLGKRGEDSYRVRTPVATIGIRGTHYSLRLCAGDCDEVTRTHSANFKYHGANEPTGSGLVESMDSSRDGNDVENGAGAAQGRVWLRSRRPDGSDPAQETTAGQPAHAA
jgi:hypothetical protein